MYIGVSGIDGSGKTTITNIISEYIIKHLNKKTFLCDAMKPGFYNNELKSTEKLLCGKNAYDEYFSPEMVNLAFCADLYENYINIIKPKLNEGYVVISHRSRLCCRVYSEVFTKKLTIVDMIMQSIPFPDISFHLKTSPNIAMNRVHNREIKECIPVGRKENIPTFEKANKIYEQIIHDSCSNIITINGDNSISEIQNEITGFLLAYINDMNKGK